MQIIDVLQDKNDPILILFKDNFFISDEKEQNKIFIFLNEIYTEKI